MKDSSNQAAIRGICLGAITSILINLWIILSFYFDLNIVIVCLMVATNAVITYLFLHGLQIKRILLLWFMSVVSFVLVETIIGNVGVISAIYQSVYREYEMSLGDGLGILFMYIYNLIGALFGLLVAIIVTAVKNIRQRSTKVE